MRTQEQEQAVKGGLSEAQLKALRLIQDPEKDWIFIYRAVGFYSVFVDGVATASDGTTIADLDYLHAGSYLAELPTTRDLKYSTSLQITSKGLEVSKIADRLESQNHEYS